MILQGDNHPSIITLDTDISSWDDISVHLTEVKTKRKLKHWDRESVTFDKIGEQTIIICSWTQEETACLPVGRVIWDVKAMDPEAFVQFWESCDDVVRNRNDRSVIL